MTRPALTLGQRRMGLSSVLVGLALLAAACNPATATPVVLVATLVPAATATATLTPALAPSATATEEDLPEPDDSVTEVVATGTVIANTRGDVCTLLSADEAAELLGGAPVSVTPGVDDGGLGGYTINFCTWLGAGKAIVLSVVDTESADAAKNALHTALLDPNVEVAPSLEPDAILGDDVYWGVTENAVSYTAAYNMHAFSLALGGQVTASEELKAKLLELAQAVAARL